MKLAVVALFLALAASACMVQGLTQGEVSALSSLLNSFPSLSHVISADEYPLAGGYFGQSWTKPLNSVCSGVNGWDIHGIYCSGGRITKIKFTESWGQNTSSVPDLSGLSAVKSFIVTYGDDGRIRNPRACQDFALALVEAVSLEELEYGGINRAMEWGSSSSIFPFVAQSVKNITLIFPSGITMPDWTTFNKLERVSVIAYTSVSISSLMDVFSSSSNSLVELRISGSFILGDPSSATNFPNLKVLVMLASTSSSNFASLNFPASLKHLSIYEWPNTGSTTLNIASPSLEELEIGSNGRRLTSIGSLPSSLLSLTLQDTLISTWPSTIPRGLESLTFLEMQNMPVLPLDLENCENLVSLNIVGINPASVAPNVDIMPSLSSTSISSVVLENIRNLPTSYLERLICSMPSSSLKKLSLSGSLNWFSLPSCIGAFENLESLNVWGTGTSLSPNLLVNVSSSLTHLMMQPYPTTSSTPDWEGLVAQFPQMTDFQIYNGGGFGVPDFPGDILKQWNRLKKLSIPGRGMTGTMPEDFLENLENLEFLDLSSNQLSGPIPSSGWASIKHFIVDNNHFSNWTGIDSPGAPNLIEIEFFGNDLHTIPNLAAWDSMTQLEYVSLMNNENLEGWMPMMWTRAESKIRYFYASDNLLQGTIPPIHSRYLAQLLLSDAELCGSLPEIHGGALKVKSWAFNQNHFSGSIPHSWAYLYPESVSIEDNLLEGNIPDDMFLAVPSRLRGLQISGNYFTGPIPDLSFHPELKILTASGINMTIDWCTGSNTHSPYYDYCDLAPSACSCLSAYWPVCSTTPTCSGSIEPESGPSESELPIVPPLFECASPPPSMPPPSDEPTSEPPSPSSETPSMVPGDETPVGHSSKLSPSLPHLASTALFCVWAIMLMC